MKSAQTRDAGEIHVPLASGRATVVRLMHDGADGYYAGSGEQSSVVWASGQRRWSAVLAEARGIKAARVEGDFVVFETGSGTFAFEAR